MRSLFLCIGYSGGGNERKPQALTCDIIRGMKMMAVTCAIMMCASAFGAVMPQLPEPVYADTEVCTNVPCAALCECKM